MNDGYYDRKHRQQTNGVLATKARWEAEDWRINLNLILGAPEDLSTYADCLAGARQEGLHMDASQRAEARWLASNPK